MGSCAKTGGLRTTWWGQYCLWTEETKGQEHSVLAESFYKENIRGKRHTWEYCYWKEHFAKEFYKWKLLQVQAIFKNTTTWVAGRRVTAVFKYFSEGMNTQTSFSCLSQGTEVNMCVGPGMFGPAPSPFEPSLTQ